MCLIFENLQPSKIGLFRREEEREDEITITLVVRIADRKLVVKEWTILEGLSDNVVATSGSTFRLDGRSVSWSGFNESNCSHVVFLGTL